MDSTRAWDAGAACHGAGLPMIGYWHGRADVLPKSLTNAFRSNRAEPDPRPAGHCPPQSRRPGAASQPAERAPAELETV
jgi:hypothetical protein